MLISDLAHAQATRTWVSGVGDDANPCSRTAPCKTLAGAISKTAAGGLIMGGFGAVTITKSLTIDCTETFAGVLAAGTNVINIPTSGIVVFLRGLSIEGVGVGLIGINVTGGATVQVERYKIFGFQAGTAQGIRVALTSGATRLFVSDTVISQNGAGIVVLPNFSGALASFQCVTLQSNAGEGLRLSAAGGGAIFASVVDSLASINGSNSDQWRGDSVLRQQQRG